MAAVRALRFVVWGNAVLAGVASPDDAVSRIVGADTRHRVRGLPDEAGEVSIAMALGQLRRSRADGLRLALPCPGDPVGLSGPAAFNSTAIEAGGCVLAGGPSPVGLLPQASVADGASFVLWQVYPTQPSKIVESVSLADAERELTETMREVTAELTRLDVAGLDARTAGGLTELRSAGAGDQLGPHYPPRAHRLLALAQQLRSIVNLALGENGAAMNAREIAGRSSAISRLDPVIRRAMMAAANSVLEPQHIRP